MRQGHNDKVLTLAMSRLIQSDLQLLIVHHAHDKDVVMTFCRSCEERQIKKLVASNWRVVDGGVTQAVSDFGWGNPRASFFIRQLDYEMPVDWTLRMRAQSGGPYFKVFVRINTFFDDSSISGAVVDNEFKRIYDRQPHAVCTMFYGDFWGDRWSTRGKDVCVGVFGLINNPNVSEEIANKMLVVMNSYLTTNTKIYPR
jgi:hypothetical protein